MADEAIIGSTEADVAKAANPNRPTAYINSAGTIVVRASGLGRCIREIVAGCQGYEPMAPPESMQNRFDDGHLHEDSIMTKAAAMSGWEILTREEDGKGGERQIRALFATKAVPGIIIVGSLDGLTPGPPVGGSGRFIVDAKALSQSSHDTWEKQEWTSSLGMQYAWQQAAYIAAKDADGVLMATKNKNTGVVTVHLYDRDDLPVKKADIIKRMIEIKKAVEAAKDGGLPPCSVAQFPCAFYYLHEEAEVEVTEDAFLERLARERDAASKAEAEAKRERERLDNEIRDYLGGETAEAERLTFTGIKVKTSVGQRNVFDDAAWQADHPDINLDAYYRKVPNSKATVYVTVPKPKTSKSKSKISPNQTTLIEGA